MTALAETPDPLAVPLDLAHLDSQWPGLAAFPDPATWYLRQGLSERLNPTPFFLTDWYAWQNPDWTSHDAPYLHYLQVGRHEARDPSPFVDVRRYLDVTGPLTAPGTIYDLILDGHRSPALGVYETGADLGDAQRAFLGAIACVAHRHRLTRPKRRSLVVLQAGPGSMAQSWFDDEVREWDLLVNYYDARGFQPGLGDYVFFQKGTKFTAMWLIWSRFREVFSGYDYVLFLDDDVATGCRTLNRLFRSCRTHALDLAQMALTPESSCNWPELFARDGTAGPRVLGAVEIMMPVFSARALRTVAPTFGKSISGFGLDLAWGKLVSDAGGRIAVLDDARATHARPVDQSDGAYYTYLRRHGINAKAELWAMTTEYETSRAMGLQDCANTCSIRSSRD